jgi:hypothetical protein
MDLAQSVHAARLPPTPFAKKEIPNRRFGDCLKMNMLISRKPGGG